jgi:hypothetical protein
MLAKGGDDFNTMDYEFYEVVSRMKLRFVSYEPSEF